MKISFEQLLSVMKDHHYKKMVQDGYCHFLREDVVCFSIKFCVKKTILDRIIVRSAERCIEQQIGKEFLMGEYILQQKIKKLQQQIWSMRRR